MSQPILMYPAAAGSGPIVYDAYDKWSSIALKAFATAQQLSEVLGDIPIDTVAFNASFNPQIALSGFNAPTPPALPGDIVLHTPPLPPPPPEITVPVLPPLTYVSDLIDALKTTLTTLLGGNPMPAALAAALRNRAYSDANAEEARAIDNAYSEFASRGHFEPAGQLNKRVTEARADARMKRQQMNRDVFVQEQTVVIENLRFALNAGIQLEGMKVTVFRAEADVELEQVRTAVEVQKLVQDAWRAKVELFEEQLKVELARIDTETREFEAQVRVYSAQAQVAGAQSEANDRSFQLNLAQEQAIVSTEMKRQDQQFEQLRYVTSVMLEIKKTLADVSSRLASAAMSAVNVGASLSSSDGQSVSYGLSVGFSGQVDDT